MVIEVNNRCKLELTPKGEGATVTSKDEHGDEIRRDYFDAGEIVAALDLLRYMRDEGKKEVYIFHDDTRQYLLNLIDNGYVEDFRIFQ